MKVVRRNPSLEEPHDIGHKIINGLFHSGNIISNEEWHAQFMDIGQKNHSGLNLDARHLNCPMGSGKTAVLHFSKSINTSENIDVALEDLFQASAQCFCKNVLRLSTIWLQSECINFVWFDDGPLVNISWKP